jgi:hypothetical protein
VCFFTVSRGYIVYVFLYASVACWGQWREIGAVDDGEK